MHKGNYGTQMNRINYDWIINQTAEFGTWLILHVQ